ncbi:serpin family protein [Candidatus Woesearchaeota archaeon]|nr:serpin family protein [Candidatus Woesearchaeota archaeon]
MNKKILITGLVLLMIGIVTATTILFFFPYQPNQPPVTNQTDSTPQGMQQVVNANNQFSFDLYAQLDKSEQGNIFYSPYSIAAALAMTAEGANGKTADEIQSVFHFPEQSVLRPNFAAIYNNLNQRSSVYQLSTGNALWVQYDYPLLDEYTSTVEQYYGGKVANLDFKQATEQSRQTINAFIEQQTNNKIKGIIPQGYIDPMTRLVLTNAIYFKGTWAWEFDKSETRDQDFKITPTNVVKTPMMFMDPNKARFLYAATDDAQLLELPYKGDKLSMLIILPTENLDAIESSLSAEKLNQYKSQMKATKLDAIYLPKFTFDTKYFMKGTLSALGMPTAFSGAADFSGMSGKKDLQISEVIHQAFVSVDEEGTEAAAATAVVIRVSAAILPTNVFRADHPFIFIIQEKAKGNILFMGRVTDPRD